MKFPFMLRSDHDAHMKLLNLNVCILQESIQDKNRQLIEKEQEIQALILQLAANRVTEVAVESKKRLGEAPILIGRSAWRSQATLKSQSTVPAPKDSAKALEEKVIREGGTT